MTLGKYLQSMQYMTHIDFVKMTHELRTNDSKHKQMTVVRGQMTQ